MKKMTTTMTIRELAERTKNLDKYTSIEIIDKRKKQRRGIYLSEREAIEYKKWRVKQKKKNIEVKRKAKKKEYWFDKYVGILDGATEGKSYKELKMKRAIEKYES